MEFTEEDKRLIFIALRCATEGDVYEGADLHAALRLRAALGTEQDCHSVVVRSWRVDDYGERVYDYPEVYRGLSKQEAIDKLTSVRVADAESYDWSYLAEVYADGSSADPVEACAAIEAAANAAAKRYIEAALTEKMAREGRQAAAQRQQEEKYLQAAAERLGYTLVKPTG